MTTLSPTAAAKHPAAQPQSLADGVLGIALHAIEAAATGHGTWAAAHRLLAVSTWDGGLNASPDTHLFYGAPALAFAVTGAHQRHPNSCRKALAALDEMVDDIVRARLRAAHERIDARQLPTLSEFDTIRGLAGLGAHLLRRDPNSPALRDVLDYLVRLTEPIRDDGDTLPGWWTHLDPGGKPSPSFPGGHANTGMAHGIGGPLALLALTAIRGVTVPGQLDAIHRIHTWLDRWQQTTPSRSRWIPGRGRNGTWWPYWVTRTELRTGRLEPRGPQRPSWCYGTPGLARSQQLAAIATDDTSWKQAAETALIDALTDPRQLELLTDNSLCHGLAGAAYIARLAAADSTSAQLRRVADHSMAAATRRLRKQPAVPPLAPGWKPSFLEGSAGTDLALRTDWPDAAPRTSWDTCLLINAPT